LHGYARALNCMTMRACPAVHGDARQPWRVATRMCMMMPIALFMGLMWMSPTCMVLACFRHLLLRYTNDLLIQGCCAAGLVLDRFTRFVCCKEWAVLSLLCWLICYISSSKQVTCKMPELFIHVLDKHGTFSSANSN